VGSTRIVGEVIVRAFLLAAAIALIFPPLIDGQSSEKMPALSIAHAAMRVSDLAKSREFYQKLGFEEAFVLEKNGSPTEIFVKVNDRQFIELYPRENDTQAPGFLHVCFESSDIETLNRIYKERGITSTPVSRGSAGNLLFSVRYPAEQVIEFTQYMAGSMHSNDRGKHLGVNRISEHMTGVGMPVVDPSAMISFYEDRLGFRRAPSSPGYLDTLLLPGASGEMLEMLPRERASGFTLFFSVSDLPQTKSALKKAHMSADKHDSALSIMDPDGNHIVFVKN
jgi:catechol 2,3-dioxygenase-like lactoylglutathione lyase family enzyme